MLHRKYNKIYIFFLMLQSRGDCKYLGKRVCNGSIVTTLKYTKLVRVCQDGKLKYKPIKDVSDAALRAAESKTKNKGNFL